MKTSIGRIAEELERLALKSREVNVGGTGVAIVMQGPASVFKASDKSTIRYCYNININKQNQYIIQLS